MITDELVTWEDLEARLKPLLRAKTKERIINLEWLKDAAKYPAQKLMIGYLFVQEQTSSWMDIDYMSIPSLMPIEVWRSLIKDVLVILEILTLNPEISMRIDEINLEWIENYRKGPNFEGKVQILGDLSDLVLKLNHHFFMGLMHTHPDTEEHKRWILQEPTIYFLCQNVLEYFVRAGLFHLSAEVARILHTFIYYKTPEMYSALHYTCEENTRNDDPVDTSQVVHHFREDQDARMTELREFVLNFGDKLLQNMVKLCDIYHWAIRDNFSKAIEGMLCFLREGGEIDYLIQFDFNRALAQLGLCAFRAGCILEAYSCLSWLYGGGKVNILLGQALTHLPVDEIGQKPREGYVQIPHHLHIDLKVLKQVYSICAMLLEFPDTDELTGKEFVTDDIDEDVLVGIMALREGNLSETIKLIEGLDLWGLLKEGEILLEFVKVKIQEVAFVNHQHLLFPVDPNSIEAGNQFKLTKGRRHQLFRQCFFSETVSPVRWFPELVEKLSFFASNHMKIFEGSIYKFPMRALSDSSEVRLLDWIETSLIPLPVLRLFLYSEGLETSRVE